MEYRPESQNVMADCLSIFPLLTAIPLVDFKAEYEDWPKRTKLTLTILSGWAKVKKSLPDEVKPYFLMQNKLAAELTLIFRGTRLIFPKSM